MTNLEKWRSINSALPSPNNYIDWAWRFLIAASLQRRVWMPPDHMKCFANMNVILVGEPGLGKGVIISPVTELLREHVLDTTAFNSNAVRSPDEKAALDNIIDAEVKAAQAAEINGKQSSKVPAKSLLIPMAANATSYEALVKCLAQSYRRINYTEFDQALGRDTMKIYGHSSLAFALPEIASLFRKRVEDLVNLLHEGYDCSEVYEYDTISRGKDRIKRVCLNMLGGTTPDFMQDTFKDGLIEQGFCSRTFFVFAAKNRPSSFWISELTPEQKMFKKDISNHIKELTKLYGRVKLTPEAIQYLEEWWAKEQANPSRRSNQSIKLKHYYSRKKVHILKCTMAHHFGEDCERDESGAPKNPITKPEIEYVIEMLNEEEKCMHLALTLDGDNPQYKTAKKILGYLRTPRTFNEIFMEFYESAKKQDIEEILTDMMTLGKIKSEQKKDEATQEDIMWYQAI